MSLLDIRTQVVERTGRFDLVGVNAVGTTHVPDYEVDMGIDRFVHEARQWLYARFPKRFAQGMASPYLTAGEYRVGVPFLRVPDALWWTDASGNKTQLAPKPLRWLQTEYGTAWASVTQGTPLYWCSWPTIDKNIPLLVQFNSLYNFASYALDGTGTVIPGCLCTDGVDRVFVVDQGTGAGYPTRIQEYTANGVFVRAVYISGVPLTNVYYGIYYLHLGAVVLSDTLIWTDAGDDVFYTHNLSTGVTVAHMGSGGGPNQLNTPKGICADDHEIFIADYGNSRIQVVSINTGVSVRRWLLPVGVNGQGKPVGVAEYHGRLYVADGINLCCYIYDLNGNLLGTFGSPGTSHSEFQVMGGISVSDDLVYVCDTVQMGEIEVYDLDGNFRYYVGGGQVNAGYLVLPTHGVVCNNKLYITTQLPAVRVYEALRVGESQHFLVVPPTDTTGAIDVYGTFYPAPYAGAQDSDFLCAQAPELLILATCYCLERANRNTQGADDYMAQLAVHFRELDADQTEQDMVTFEDEEGLFDIQEWE